MFDPEFLKALGMVAEFDANRPVPVKELRVYYNTDGTIIGLWETDHPESGNYIVIDNRHLFDTTSTYRLRVVNKELIKLDALSHETTRLKKSVVGQAVVHGHAAIALTNEETYANIDYYEYT